MRKAYGKAKEENTPQEISDSVVHSTSTTGHFQRVWRVRKGAIHNLLEYPLVRGLSVVDPVPVDPNRRIIA